jgi:SPP1 gp7 family putative phage head morphogenesis protein
MKTVSMPPYQKQHEKTFGKFMAYMIEAMGSQFKNETFNKLHVKTINKFEDAQVGNYANVFIGLSKKAQRKILKRFSDARIQKFVFELLSKVDDVHKAETYKQFEGATGLSRTQMIAGEGLTPQMNALKAETNLWALKLRDETLQTFTSNAVHAMATGQSMEEVIAGFDLTKSKKVNAGQFVARNQIATFNSLASKMRMQKAGVQKAIWITAGDERVRPCHEVRNKKEFILSEGLYSSCDGKDLLPGVDYNCRCRMKAIFEEDEDA